MALLIAIYLDFLEDTDAWVLSWGGGKMLTPAPLPWWDQARHVDHAGFGTLAPDGEGLRAGPRSLRRQPNRV